MRRCDRSIVSYFVRAGVGHDDIDTRQIEVCHRCERTVGGVRRVSLPDVDSVSIDMSERAEVG